jgi:hypothetical protein
VCLYREEPADVDSLYLQRARDYPIQDDDGSSASGTDWEGVVAASTRDGRLGAAVKGPARDAFQRFIRLAGQMGGEEGALDSAASLLYETLTAGDGSPEGESGREEVRLLPSFARMPPTKLLPDPIYHECSKERITTCSPFCLALTVIIGLIGRTGGTTEHRPFSRVWAVCRRR